MSDAIQPEAAKLKHSRRGKWRRRVFRATLIVGLLVLLFHQPILTAVLRQAAIRLAARDNVALNLEISGSVWTNLTLKNVRALPTGTSPVESITIERLRVKYNLITLFRSGPENFLTSYHLRNANLVLDPVRGNEDQKQKLARVLRDILQQPAMYSDRAQVENFNLTFRATEGTYICKGVEALLDPTKQGYIRVAELTIPNIGSWRDLHTTTSYINRHLILRDFNLGDEVRVARFELDASLRVQGVVYLSFEGTVLGGDVGIFLWQRDIAPGVVKAQLTANVSNLPLDALRKYGGWRMPISGNLAHGRLQISGDPLAPVGWTGQVTAELEQGAIGGFAIGEASAKLTLASGVARLDSLQLSTGENRLTFQAERALPATYDKLHFTNAEATFTVDAPQLSCLHAAFTGGRVKGAGSVALDGKEIAIKGNVTASDIKGKDFGLEQGGSAFNFTHSLQAKAFDGPWYTGFTGQAKVEASGLRFREFAARHLLLDAPVTGETARIAEFALDLNGKDKLSGKVNVTLREPFAYEGNLAGSVQDLSIFQPFVETPLGGALEIDWHGTGEIQLLRHTGEGRLALKNGRLGMLTEVEGELAGVYSPESIDITTLRVRSDQGALQAGVRLRDQRLHVEKLRLTAGTTGIITGAFSLPLDLRTPTRPETVFPPSGPLQGALVLDEIDLAKVFPAARPGLGIHGLVNGSLTLGGTFAAPDLVAKVQARNLQHDTAAKLTPATGDATLLFQKGRLALSGTLAQPGLNTLLFKGAMPLDLQKTFVERQLAPTTPITFSVKLPPSPASIFSPFIPGVRFLDGRLSVDASATGTLANPVFNGGIALDLPAIRFKDADLPGVNHFQGDLRFSGTQLTFQRFTGDTAGGPFSVTGKIRLDQITNPLLDLRVQSEGTLLVRNDTLTLRMNSDLRITGPVNTAHVAGKLGLTKSRFFRDIEILPIGLPGRPAPKPSQASFVLSTDTAPFCNWTLDVAIKTDEPFTVRGNLANGSLIADLYLGGSGLAPTLDGVAHIDNFVASLPFSRLAIDHGALYFSGNATLNPTLDIHGSSRIRDYNVNVYLYGSVNEPQTLFTSEPALPQEEIIALLATGATTRDFAQNNQVLAGRAAVLLFQDLYHKAFPRRAQPTGAQNPMDRFSLDVGAVDPRSGRQELMGKLKLSNEYEVGAGVDMQGDVRMQLRYLLRFR